MSSLLIPHFGLGLGIGILDAALVPYLSSRIDAKYAGEINSDCSASDSVSSSYGTVYAIQQMAVSLAYSVSPLLASEVVKFIGFPMLMLSIGVLNVGYAVLFYYFTTGGPRTVSNYFDHRTSFKQICFRINYPRRRTSFWPPQKSKRDIVQHTTIDSTTQ